MDNDPELSGKYLGTITEDFIKVSETLRETSYQIRKKGFSDHPIFPIGRTTLPVGLLLVGKEEMGNQWIYNAAYLDEFVQRNIIDKERLDPFIAAYKDPDEFCCLFVVDGEFTKFVFIPFPEN